jgi:hypothetical protein
VIINGVHRCSKKNFISIDILFSNGPNVASTYKNGESQSIICFILEGFRYKVGLKALFRIPSS